MEFCVALAVDGFWLGMQIAFKSFDCWWAIYVAFPAVIVVVELAVVVFVVVVDFAIGCQEENGNLFVVAVVVAYFLVFF